MKQKWSRGELLLKGPGRDRLLAYAQSFEDLSKSFYFLPDKPPENPAKKREILWYNRMAENRLVVAGQLKEVSKIITEMADDISMVEDVGNKKEEKIRKYMKREGLSADKILIVENKENRLEIYMELKADWGSHVAAREAADILSKAIRIKMVPSRNTKSLIDENFHKIIFEEAPEYQILTGYAKLKKDGEEESGDSFSFASQDDGRFTMSLSDGMGSGHVAAYESRVTIELLEQFLDAGFDTESAIKMINGAMLGRNEEQTVTSLDVIRIDLHRGTMDYVKSGAAASFVRRENGMDIIRSESMPLGIFQKPDFDKGHKKLYDGDIIVMVTDGVLDRIQTSSPEKVLAGTLRRIKSTNPREIAKRLLSYTVNLSEAPCRDDMTVLAAAIWKNQ